MKTRGTAKNIMVLLFAAGFLLVLLEASLALFWPHRVTTRQYHGKYHPVMGWVNTPAADGKVKVTRGVYFHRRHNGRGLRGPREYGYDKPSGVRRILLLGDSFFWGFGVDDQDVISSQLQQRFGINIEVMNGAVTGYGTDQELLWLAEEGLKYRPDLVILGFFPTNDIDEISNSVMYGYPKPYFSLEGEHLVARNIPVPDTRETRRKAFEEPDTSFGRLKKFLRHNTHTYQFIVGRLNSIPAIRHFLLDTGIAEEFTTELPGVPRYSLDPSMAQALSEALIREMKRISEEAGAGFLLVFIPQKEQAQGYRGVERGAYEWNTRVSTYLSSFTEKNAIPYCDLLPVFRRHHDRGERLYTPGEYDHHWSPPGHRVAADALHECMGQNGWIRSPERQSG